MLNHIMHSNQQVVTHPVEHLTADDIASLPVLPMTQSADGTWYCDGESTQETTKGYQLFDKSTAQYGYIKRDGTVESVTWIKCTDFIKVSGNYVYTYQCIDTTSNIRYYVFYDSEKNFISGAVQQLDGKLDIPENAVYFRCNVQTGLLDTAIITVDYIPAEMEYEPYTGGKPSPNPDYQSPIINTYPAGTYKAVCGDKVYKVVLDDDLRSVPTYADRVTIDAERGLMWIERKIKPRTLNGNEIMANVTSYVYAVHFGKTLKSGLQTSMCNRFRNDNSTIENKNGYGIYCDHSTTDHKYFRVNGMGIESQDDFRNWLKNNETILNYTLAEKYWTTHQSIPTQLLTIQSGRSAQLLNTVNDKADYLAVKGDSWQLVQDEIVDAGGNVIQPAMPSSEHQSEIKDVGGTLRSCGWNLFDVKKAIDTATGDFQDKTYFRFENGKTYDISCISRVESYSIWFAISATGFNSPIGNAKLFFSSIGKVSMTVTIPDDGCEYYLYLCYNGRPSNSQYMNFFNGTLCEDIQITSKVHRPYDRHRGNSITLPTLRGLPDGTRDVLYVDRKAKRAWVERKVGHEILDGITDGYRIYSVYSVRDNVVRFGVYTNNKYLSISNKKMLCNYLRDYAKGAPSWLSDEENIFWHISQSSAGFYFSLSKTLLSQYGYDGETKDSAITAGNAWLQAVYEKGEPFEILFELAEPVIEELPYSDYLLDTCQWETNLFVDCDANLVPEIEVGCKVLGR